MALDRGRCGPLPHLYLHNQLEAELAKFKKAEACLTFQGGFMANLATIPALVVMKMSFFC